MANLERETRSRLIRVNFALDLWAIHNFASCSFLNTPRSNHQWPTHASALRSAAAQPAAGRTSASSKRWLRPALSQTSYAAARSELLVGAAYVAGELPALKDFAQSLTWPAIARMLDVRLSGGGLIAGQEIVAFLRKLKISAPIASYSKPFAAVATDLETGREIWLREGPIEEAVRASISIPGILSPARHADRWLVDGGLVNPVPVSVCRALGADVVIAVNLNGDLVGRHANGQPRAQCRHAAAHRRNS